MPAAPVFVVINPAAGRGRGARRIPGFLQLLRDELPAFDHALTTRPGEERALTEKALSAGAETIVVIGGDGTWSSVADTLLSSGKQGVRLALLAGGTGNDFGKTFGITFEKSREIVRAIRDGNTTRIDVGRVREVEQESAAARSTKAGGSRDGRHFLNVVGIGFDIAVIQDAATFRWLKGDALYKFCAIRQLFRFPGTRLSISGDFGPAIDGDFLMVVVANARYFGGSFLIAPDADLTDGRLDLVAIKNASPARRASLFGHVAKGTHASDPEVTIAPSASFRLDFEGAASYEIDGEVLTTDRPLVVESVPNALELVVP